MPKIICIASQKGGVGKSTICFNLACMFSKSLQVALLDLDLQSSSSDLLKEETGITVVPPSTAPSALTELPYDLLFIDTPPYLSTQLIDILLVADVILIPTKAGAFDVLALKDTLKLVEQVQLQNKYLKAAIIFTMVKTGTKTLDEIKPVLHTGSINILSNTISERVSYTRSLLTGGVILTTDNKAKMEMMELADEVVKLLGL